MQNDVETRLKKILKDNYGMEDFVEQVGQNDDLSSFHMNSLDFIKFIVFIEDEFEIEVDEDHLIDGSFKSFGDMVHYIEQAMDENA